MTHKLSPRHRWTADEREELREESEKELLLHIELILAIAPGSTVVLTRDTLRDVLDMAWRTVKEEPS